MFVCLFFRRSVMNSHSKSIKINFLSVAFFLSAIFLIGIPTFAAATVDPAFAPVPSRAITAVGSLNQLVQPDGKVVLWGGDYVVDGLAKGQIVRLNADGSADNTFSYCGCLMNSITNVGLQPDGKLLLAGSNGHSRMVRLNTDGTQDTTFGAYYPVGIASTFEFIAMQSDNKIFATASGSLGSGFHAGYLVRLNQDGTTDSGFTAITYDSGRLIWGYLRAAAIEPSGKVYLSVTTYSGSSSTSSLRRFNSNGTLDSAWELPNFTTSGGSSLGVDITGLDVQPDGALVAGGRFDSVNGVGKKDFVRLMPAGNVDLNFSPPVAMGSGGGRVKVLASGKILVGFNTTGIGRLGRLNSDGSLDNTFVLSPTVTQVSNRWGLDASERIVFLGISDQPAYRYFRLNPNGDVDGSFNPNVTVPGQIHSVALQTNGKAIIAGDFSQLNGLPRKSIARINADGTPDMTFDPGTGFSSPPSRVIVQADGKILAIGGFSTFNGVTKSYLARLNSDGSLDAAFDPTVTTVTTPPVTDISLQADQRILIVGYFTGVNGTARTGIARLQADGTLDATFDPTFSGSNLYAAVQQADGKVMVGGSFTGVNGFNRSNLVRLNTDGSLDQTFNAAGVPSINKIVIQPDGKYLFINYAGSPSGMGRRNSDGSNDTSFTVPVFTYNGSCCDQRLESLILQSDGSIIVGGWFQAINGTFRNNLVRLRSNGALDQLFFPNGANYRVRSMAAQADGNVILGGDFSMIGTFTRVAVARIIPGLFTRTTPFDYDGDGKADVSVFRASENQWYILRSSDFGVTQAIFAIAGDIPTPADFDGDGRTDIAIYRPSSGDWWSLSTINNQQVNYRWGQAGDIPLPTDWDGDGKSDYVLFRPSTNQWLKASSANPSTSTQTFGLAGDKPVIGDFDGDGKSDVAVYRPSDGNWWWWSSLDGIQRATRWGIATDIPAPADYDGDGKTDFAVYRPSTGVWYIYNSATNSPLIGPFGLAEDKPVPADYDGDGKADIAVFRPSTGIWYLLRTTSGFTGLQFGISTDLPTQNVFLR